MKKLIFIALMLIGMISQAQTVTKDAQGNYHAQERTKSERSGTGTSKDSGKTFTDANGKIYPVLIGAKGGMYYNRTSRNGKEYKCYLPKGGN